MKKKKNMLPLPNELLILILLRLPVKALLRFRSVSKLWLSLISDPHFATSHFELASAPTHRIMLLKSSLPQTRCIDVDASLHDDSASAVTKLSFQLPTPLFDVQILGSCRGFLLLWDHYYSDMYLWNPSTGVHKQLPLSPIASNINSSFFTYLYGFGHDPSTDDYLWVLGSYDPSADWVTQFEFFSLRANSWKKFEGTHLPYMNCSDEPRVGSLLNGAIHWLAFRNDVSLNVILAFDLVERSFSEIPLPNDFECDFNSCDLWVHGGCLSLCVQGWDAADIWVMEEYKVQSSWTKSIAVPYDDIPTQYFSAICSTESGDIFGFDGSAGLVKCNAKGEVLEHRSYPHEGEAANINTKEAMYTESLLSLPSDNEQA